MLKFEITSTSTPEQRLFLQLRAADPQGEPANFAGNRTLHGAPPTAQQLAAAGHQPAGLGRGIAGEESQHRVKLPP